MLFRFCYRYLRDEQEALDASQDTFIKVLRKLGTYNPRWRFSTWMLRIAKNTCIDRLRYQKRWRTAEPTDLPDQGASPQELTEREQRSEHLRTALDELPPLYREVIELYHFEHLKYREIAELLDVPLGTVMNRIFRARKRLRATYEILERPAEDVCPAT
jgi:RNA polymerase sigma-70 factor (ECF subfamily)